LKSGGTVISEDAMALIAAEGLPLGLAQIKLVRRGAKGRLVRWAGVEGDPADPTVAFRREMEQVVVPK
jgi:hypothetical protein